MSEFLKHCFDSYLSILFPFSTNAFPETVKNAGAGIFTRLIVCPDLIVVAPEGLVLSFHQSMKSLSCALSSFLLQEKRVFIPE